MTEDKRAFEEWLDGKLRAFGGGTRRTFAEEVKMNMHDLEWAFSAGYIVGKLVGELEGK